jgi:ABC-type phosphate transport system substrate-binding protein
MKLVAAAALCAAVLLPGRAEAGPNDLLVVVNKGNSTGSLSKDAVRNIYLGSQKFWSGQKRITPFNRPASKPAGEAFFGKVLGMSPSRYRLHWKKLELGGKGVEPKTVGDAAKLLGKVGSKSGAIGYVTRGELDAKKDANVKVVLTVSN